MTVPTSADPVAKLLEILELEQMEGDRFRGKSPQTGLQRVFGGQVIAQALAAACRTVEDRKPHSLHAYFLLPGDPKVPIDFEVDRIRDGRSFATRRVVAKQHGAAIFALSASFHGEEPGLSHQIEMPLVPRPEDLPRLQDIAPERLDELMPSVRAYFQRERPIELRPVGFTRYTTRSPMPPRFDIWLRASRTLPDDPLLHQCVLAYASDMTLLDTALVAHGRSVFEPGIQAASLDHALWFHRPFRADEWLLYSQDSPSTSQSLGFSRGQIFNLQGQLIASVAQEGLIRERRSLP